MFDQGEIIWFLSKMSILTFVLLLIGATFFWTYSERKGVVYEIRNWPQEARYSVIVTYLYLVSSYFLTVLSVSYVFQSPRILTLMTSVPKIVVFASLVVMTILTALIEFIPFSVKEYHLLKNGLWILHSVVMGPSLAYFGTYISIQTTFNITFALLLATVISFTAPQDTFIEIKPQIQTLYTTVSISSLLCFLFIPPANMIGLLLIALNLCGGMLLYFGVFMSNTQYMLKQAFEADYDPIYTAAVIYLSTLNMYLRLAMFIVVDLTKLTNNQESCPSSPTIQI